MTFKKFSLFDDEATEPPVDRSTGAPQILIIDDDEDLGAALRLTLGRLYRVVLCDNALAGIEAVSEDTSVVLLDIKMAGMDGFACYSKIREKDPDVPIIFHSAYRDLRDPYRIINEYRPFGYLTKGTELSVLLKTVAEAVAQRERSSRHRTLQRELASVKAKMEALRKKIGASG